MKLYVDEALTVYLYLKDQNRGVAEEAAYRHAWQVICDAAQTNIKAFLKPEAAQNAG